jgi:UPF0716 protein FxsA
MAKWFIFGLLALPAAEIAVFILVSAAFGFPLALALLLASSVAGAVVLRHMGASRLERLRVAVTQTGVAGLETAGGVFLTVLAGILLLVPGFITALFGLPLLLPPVQRWIGTRVAPFIQHSQSSGPAGVVDLDRDEWSQVPQQSLDRPNRQDDPR